MWSWSEYWRKPLLGNQGRSQRLLRFRREIPRKGPHRSLSEKKLEQVFWLFSNIDCTMMNEYSSERSIRVLYLAPNPRLLRPIAAELWSKAWGYLDPQRCGTPGFRPGGATEAPRTEAPQGQGYLTRTALPERVCNQKFGWLKLFNLQKSLKMASVKLRFLEDEKRWEKIFGILERHLPRSIFWYRSHLPAPPNVNDQNLGKSDLSWILAWSGLIGYNFQGHTQSSKNREQSSIIQSVRSGSPEISRLWSPRKNLNFLLLWWFSGKFGDVIFVKFDLCKGSLL